MLIFVTLLWLGLLFGLLGYFGLKYQSVIISEALQQREQVFIRDFELKELKRDKNYPFITRLRNNGIGDLIFGADGHWEYTADFADSPSFHWNHVGFLSLPDVELAKKKLKL